jgi:leucyl aminopeptidase
VHVQSTTESPYAVEGADTIAVGVFEGEDVAHDIGAGTLQSLLDRKEGKRAFRHLALAHADGRRVILVGLGKRARFDSERARTAAAVVHERARELGTGTLCWEVPHHVGDDVVGGLVEGTLLHAYRFTRYRPEPDPEEAGAAVERLLLSAHHEVVEPVRRAALLARAQNRARDLANAPPNDLTPSALAQYAEQLAEESGGAVSVEVLDGSAIRTQGMGALAAVARGSAEDPRVIVLSYAGAGAQDAAPLGLIGKGVTFDSGGLWLKPGASQRTMKFDMCGAAAVIEAVRALSLLEAPVRVKAVVGAVENLPGPTATRPGDIVKALDGTTVEIENTDAEGRLVLGDCIAYALRGGCTRLIDIATLTGAVQTALGSVHAGLLSNDDTLAAELERAGERTGELVWRLPLHPEYAAMIRARNAQITNYSERREAQAITAAEFLHHFAGETPWAHLDIAGVAWDVRRPYLDRAGTGFGVRLLVEAALALSDTGRSVA